MKFVSIEKRSKKDQKAYYSSQRGSWGEVKPVTRITPDRKKYNRKRDKARGWDCE